MDWNKEYYEEMRRLCLAKEFEKDNGDLKRRLDDLSKDYLYESLRRYQKREKELLYRNVRQGQKLSKLFAESAEANKRSVLFSMGLFAGIVMTMNFLVKDLGDTISDDLISRKEALERLQLLKKFNTTEAMQIAIDVAEQQINFCRTSFDKERVLEEIQDTVVIKTLIE